MKAPGTVRFLVAESSELTYVWVSHTDQREHMFTARNITSLDGDTQQGGPRGQLWSRRGLDGRQSDLMLDLPALAAGGEGHGDEGCGGSKGLREALAGIVGSANDRVILEANLPQSVQVRA